MDGRDDVTPPAQAGRQAAGVGRKSLGRALGLGLITGAADDDPSAIGTYASAGAKLGPSFLWMAPLTLPMMFAVVYLSAKLGQVSGRGLFRVIKEHYPRWVLFSTLTGVLIGNTIETGADLGGVRPFFTGAGAMVGGWYRHYHPGPAVLGILCSNP
jgi:Mn2+/Fe2+ NRAMP family transporter